ncbi:MAG: TrkA family potassium uptake protein [Haliscomenobacter sp.]|nr:TrkA family potassium uptake protein [Haliscomenobacter sp.]MBK8878794.1 TrkA family potassium uptake protein [Haliscomenobacter sp.]
MKIIIFGIGNFGASLAMQLSEMGHEVIAIDKNPDKVELIKDQVTHTICLDSTNLVALRSLPLRDTDVAIVGIGENEGASILTTANLKTLGVPRVISRSISPTHQTVLEAMGIDEILHPEQDAAERLAKKLNLRSAIETFDLDPNHSVVELELPHSFVGKTVVEVDMRKNYNLNIVTVIRKRLKRNLLGINKVAYVAEGVVKPETHFEEGDILVVFGANTDIQHLCRNQGTKWS